MFVDALRKVQTATKTHGKTGATDADCVTLLQGKPIKSLALNAKFSGREKGWHTKILSQLLVYTDTMKTVVNIRHTQIHGRIIHRCHVGKSRVAWVFALNVRKQISLLQRGVRGGGAMRELAG